MPRVTRKSARHLTPQQYIDVNNHINKVMIPNKWFNLTTASEISERIASDLNYSNVPTKKPDELTFTTAQFRSLVTSLKITYPGNSPDNRNSNGLRTMHSLCKSQVTVLRTMQFMCNNLGMPFPEEAQDLLETLTNTAAESDPTMGDAPR